MNERRNQMEHTSSPNDMLCSCIGFRLRDLSALLDAEPGIGFEEIQNRTRVGQTCTACMLDLEYQFTRHSRSGNWNGQVIKTPSGIAEKTSLKKRFYSLLDGLSPLVPMHLENVLPVFYSVDINQVFWTSNCSLKGGIEEAPKTVEVHVEIRDHKGLIVRRIRHTLERDQSIQEDISSDLLERYPSPFLGLGMGSIRTYRRFNAAGVRGTTRPQIEVVGKGGTGIVHGQALAGRQDRWFTLWPQHTDGHYFLSVVNGHRHRPLNVTCEGPFRMNGSPFAKQTQLTATLPPCGCSLIDLGEFETLIDEDVPYSIVWRPDGLNASHIVATNRSISRLSVDHPS